MSIQHTMSRSLRSLAICSCLALAAGCDEKDGKDTAGDSKATEGGGSTNGEGGSDPTEGNTAASPVTDATDATDATNATNDTNDTNAQTCDGDWTLGSVPFSGDPSLGHACDDPVVPKNCADGTYISFPATGECVCIAQCASLGLSVGQDCTKDGSWVCAKIEATNASMNSATACVPVAWDLCTAESGSSGGESASASGGESASASGGESASASGGDEEGSCFPAGTECSFNDDCCSENCDFGVCA